MHRPGMLSIWFFVGVLLLVYGILILGSGLYELVSPPARTVVLAELHAGVWWGGLLLLMGGFYTFHFGPWRNR